MTSDEFTAQFNRLARDWPKTYPKSKQAALWHHFKEKPVEVLQFCITQALKKSRYSPTLAEIEGQETNYREMRNAQSKKHYASDAKEFHEGSSYCGEEEAQMMKIIRARMNGRVSDRDYEDFKRGLKETADKVK